MQGRTGSAATHSVCAFLSRASRQRKRNPARWCASRKATRSAEAIQTGA